MNPAYHQEGERQNESWLARKKKETRAPNRSMLTYHSGGAGRQWALVPEKPQSLHFHSSGDSSKYGIPVRKRPRVSIPPIPFSPVSVFRNTSQTLTFSINGVYAILAAI